MTKCKHEFVYSGDGQRGCWRCGEPAVRSLLRLSLDNASKQSVDTSVLEKKERECERLRTMSAVEMMCENENVNQHIGEWEARCLKAESTNSALTRENGDLRRKVAEPIHIGYAHNDEQGVVALYVLDENGVETDREVRGDRLLKYIKAKLDDGKNEVRRLKIEIMGYEVRIEGYKLTITSYKEALRDIYGSLIDKPGTVV